MNYCDGDFKCSEYKEVTITNFNVKLNAGCTKEYTITFRSSHILSDEEVGDVVKELSKPQRSTVKLRYK